ncbi:MAG: Flp pilus assembly complex ATPase component TadA, partial [Actinobacteria bacterium]|nr:Flp pilus assembly complex ATPase component TadA [Actinomycetota bacterium]
PGSGLTTTLYAALREVDTAELNVLTMEDPVERQLEGIDQIEVDPAAGVTASSDPCLRSRCRRLGRARRRRDDA